MGVSFKVARVGSRYKPKLLQIEEDNEIENGYGNDHQDRLNEGRFDLIEDKVAGHSKELAEPALHRVLEDPEVSFSLNLFENGFSFGKPAEVFNDVPKQLVPYDRASETLFTAIEYGWLPGDVFDQIPCKYVNGAVLCEIQDYRNCLSQKAGTAAAESSPTIHKVLLQMCMENVVKDILSMSNESWSYGDLLEVESRILKALQPDLHLNPNPLLDRFCEETPTKKINLGITWGWKKRKLSCVPNSDSQSGICLPSIGSTQESNFQFGLAYHGIEVPTSQKNISRVVPSLQAGKVAQDNIHNYQSVDGCNKYAAADLSSPTASIGRDKREPPSLVPSERSECETETVERLILKKPRQEPDFTLEQLLGNLAEIGLSPELLRKNNLMYQQVGAEKSILERYHDLRGSLSLTNKGQHEILEGNPKLPTGMPNVTVKQEPLETTDFPNSDVRKVKDKSIIMDLRSNQSDLQQLLQKSTLSLKANSHPAVAVDKNLRNENVTQKLLPSPQVTSDVRAASLRLLHGESLPGEASVPTKQKKNICPRGSRIKMIDSLAGTRNKSPLSLKANSHPSVTVGKNLRNENVTRKVLPSPQVTSDVRAASLRLLHGESLLGEASVPTKQKKNICPRGSSIKMIDSLASTRNMSTADAIAASGNLHSNMVSDVECNPYLERFLKIGGVTQRYRMNDEHKVDQRLPSKPFFHTALVAFHLANSEDRMLKDATTNGIPLSKCFIDRKLNVSKTRTLTFVHEAYVCQRNGIFQDVSGAQIKLVMSEMVNEGNVEITLVYEQEGRDSISLPLSPNCPSTHFADLFAAQFQSLLEKEGYRIARDHIQPMVLNSDGQSSSQHPAVFQCDTAACGSVLQSSPTLIPGPSASTLRPMKSRMSARSSWQLSSQNIQSRSPLLPPVNFQLPFQSLSNNLSKPQLDIAAQVSPMNPQWPEILNKHAHLQFQMMQRQRQQEQLMQKKTLLGGLDAAMGSPDIMQLDGNIHRIGDAVMALEGPMNSPQRGQVPWIGNLGQFNNLGSNISSLNERKKCFGMMSDHPSSLLAKLGLGAPEAVGGAMMNRIPIQRSSGGVQMQRPTIPDMAFLSQNQPLPQPQVQQQLQMPYSQQQAGRLAEHVSSPLGQVNLQQFDQLQQIGTLQWSTKSAVQGTNDGNALCQW
ncbi:protein PHYTOCHROME-DEPENDENT LATE-FLOWERING [Hevea brasiliensis]|uniref:protein PHYTOCHROME-DEPENDENT LATE-FLOWERING n=1 Tax=Hevea brasiliensis TaxID=3981 RepID=UPI0025D253CF|nr:protein PHYTOCHROME-DEPENDENT LATE-FLOWERING [Hevea brasiliensis]